MSGPGFSREEGKAFDRRLDPPDEVDPDQEDSGLTKEDYEAEEADNERKSE